MYRQSKSFFSKFLFIQALSAAFIFSIPSEAQAQSGTQPSDPSKEITVKYLGIENDMMVFSVQFINETESRCNLSISNIAGEVLFRDVFRVKQFDKKFKVPKEQGPLDLVIANATDRNTRNIKIPNAQAVAIVKPTY